jgi:hypothetical protein
MKIKKLKFDGMDSFNDYGVELSYGQLVAIRNALEKDHSDPLSDEILAELNYYLDNVPGPGESTDEFKAERDAAKKTKDEAGEEVEAKDVPPNDTELEAGEGGLPPPPSDEGGPEPFTDEEGGEFEEGPELSGAEREIIDRAMPTGRPSPVGGGLPPPPGE